MDITKCLISSVFSRPVLWNYQIPQYENPVLRDQLFSEISYQLGISKKNAMIEWKSIVNRYKQECEKLHNHYERFSDSPFRSNWPYFEMMSFLKQQTLQKIFSTRPRSRAGEFFISRESATDNRKFVSYENSMNDKDFRWDNLRNDRHFVPEYHLENKQNFAFHQPLIGNQDFIPWQPVLDGNKVQQPSSNNNTTQQVVRKKRRKRKAHNDSNSSNVPNNASKCNDTSVKKVPVNFNQSKIEKWDNSVNPQQNIVNNKKKRAAEFAKRIGDNKRMKFANFSKLRPQNFPKSRNNQMSNKPNSTIKNMSNNSNVKKLEANCSSNLSKKHFEKEKNVDPICEDLNFFHSLVPYMKKFSSIQKLKVRNKIQQIILNELEVKDQVTNSLDKSSTNFLTQNQTQIFTIDKSNDNCALFKSFSSSLPVESGTKKSNTISSEEKFASGKSLCHLYKSFSNNYDQLFSPSAKKSHDNNSKLTDNKELNTNDDIQVEASLNDNVTLHDNPKSCAVDEASHDNPKSSAVDEALHDNAKSSVIVEALHDNLKSSAIVEALHDNLKSSAVDEALHDNPKSSAVDETLHDNPKSSVIDEALHDTPKSSAVDEVLHNNPKSSAVNETLHDKSEVSIDNEKLTNESLSAVKDKN